MNEWKAAKMQKKSVTVLMIMHLRFKNRVLTEYNDSERHAIQDCKTANDISQSNIRCKIFHWGFVQEKL